MLYSLCLKIWDLRYNIISLFLVYLCISLVLPMCVADPDGIPFL
jgi:hypothetical protein